MPTSGIYSLTVQRDDIIRQSMLNLGKLGEGEDPTPQEITDMALKLNMLVKQWMGKADFSPGLKTWTRRRGNLFLHNNTGKYTVGPNATGWTENFTQLTTTAASISGSNTITVAAGTTGITNGDKIGVQITRDGGNGDIQWTTVSNYVSGTGVITLGANLLAAVAIGATAYDYTTTAQNPLTIESAVLRDSSSSNEDVPMTIMASTQDYDMLPSKVDLNNISDPTSIYYEWQLTNSFLFTDVAASQDVRKYLVLTYLEEIQTFVNPTDNPEYPAEWFDPLCWGLSKRSAPMFNVPWTQSMEANYREALAIAQHKGPEKSSLFFQPGEDG